MRTALIGVCALIGSSLAIVANAQTIDLSWDACAPIVSAKSMAPGGQATFFATVTGQNRPTIAYIIRVVVSDETEHVPDAWRFDAGGCNEFLFSYSAQPPVALAKTCPALVPFQYPQVLQSAYEVVPQWLGYPTSMTTGFAALSVHPSSGGSNANPAIRYHAAHFTHDFFYATAGPTIPGVACGGFESPMTIDLVPFDVRWVDLDVEEHTWTVGNGHLTFQSNAVPAHSETWGSIKNQYRR